MSERPRIAVLIVLCLAIAGLSAKVAVCAQAPAATPAAPETAEQHFKNIQVLKGVPVDQFAQGMQFIAASLGVQCDHCHEQGAFEKDDKKPKQKAREMMKMMFAINANNFDGHRDVTCYSCHRGSLKPLTIPVIAEKEETVGPVETPDPSKLPAASALVDKYVQVLGGADAVQKVSSRVEKGTMNMLGRQFPIEVFVKAPDKRISVVHAPSGDTFTAFDGTSGWLGSAGHPARDMVGAELDAVRLDADLYLPVRIKQIFSELKTDGTEKLGDRDVYVVVAKRPERPPVKLYFDQQSGLLVRQVRYAESPLGQNPTQIDYADYRDAGGVKTPFQWTIARPSGRFTVQVEQAQQNVPIDDSKFTKPVAAAPAPH